MGFSWTTFCAQIVNLFVLVWLMKRFLYQPIIDTISKRQAYINDKVKKADDAVLQAQQEQKNWMDKVETFNKSKKKLLDTALAEISDLKQQQESLLTKELAKKRNRMQKALDQETLNLQQEIRNLLVQNFLEFSQKIISDLSTVSPLEQAVLLFKKKIESLSKTELNDIKKSYKKHKIITISLSDDLDKNIQSDLIDFVQRKFNLPEKDFTVRIEPDLIFGIEMTIGETVIEWTIKGYLDTFEGNLNAALSGLVVHK